MADVLVNAACIVEPQGLCKETPTGVRRHSHKLHAVVHRVMDPARQGATQATSCCLPRKAEADLRRKQAARRGLGTMDTEGDEEGAALGEC